MTDDLLRELAKELPWDRPDDARRDTVRSSLLLAATEIGARPSGRRRYIAIAAAFAAGALAAAIAALVILPREHDDHPAIASAAQITASSTARLEHGTIATPTGVDEIVRVRDGTVRLDVGRVPPGAHVRVHTDGAEVQGTQDFEVVVVADALTSVTVHQGTASIRVTGQRPIILAAGQTWRSSVITADLGVRPSDTRVPDTRVPDTRPSDTQTLDTRSPDTRSPDTRTSQPPDTGKPDTFTPDSRTPDTRVSPTPNSRTPDTRLSPTSASRTPDTRLSPTSASRTPDTRLSPTSASRTPDIGTPVARATDTRATDTRATDTRATDTRATDTRATDTRATDTRATDRRTSDVRTSDARTPDLRTPDQRTPDKRTPDKRTLDARAPDPRTSDARGPDKRGADTSTAGVVERRPPGPIPTTLGEKRETVGPSEGSGPAISSSTVAGGGATAGPRAATVIEAHFRAGWKLLREGKAREAAIELGAAADAGTDEPLAADARYFQAVALVRAGQGREAERVLVAFLDRAPRSLRRGRASVMLAQLIAKRGDLASARAWYRSAIDDPDPTIAAAARAGLASLEPPVR